MRGPPAVLDNFAMDRLTEAPDLLPKFAVTGMIMTLAQTVVFIIDINIIIKHLKLASLYHNTL